MGDWDNWARQTGLFCLWAGWARIEKKKLEFSLFLEKRGFGGAAGLSAAGRWRGGVVSSTALINGLGSIGGLEEEGGAGAGIDPALFWPLCLRIRP